MGVRGRNGARPVAVTGAAGFIGRHLEAALSAAGFAVHGLDLRPRPHHRALDIRRPVPPDAFAGCEVVIHLAALAGVAPSLVDPCSYRTTNVEGTRHVLLAARAAGVRRVVIASSSSVYGECHEPMAEGRMRSPLSPYAMTKAAAEDLTAHFRADMERVIVRPFTVYGPGQRADMLFARLLAGEQATLFPFVRDFTYVAEVVAGMLAAVDVDLVRQTEVFNLGSGRPVTAEELVDTMAAVTGSRPDVVWGGRRSGEPQQTWADPTKSRVRLGLPAPVSLAEGLRAQAGTKAVAA